MEISTDYLILEPLSPTRKPSMILSTSASEIPSWLFSLSNSLKRPINWVLYFWFWERFWYPFDRLPAPYLVNTSALISKLPTSIRFTPSSIDRSKSPILALLASIFFLILFIALLAVTSAKIMSFFARIIYYLRFRSA